MYSKGRGKGVKTGMASPAGTTQRGGIHVVAIYQCNGPTHDYVVMTKREYLINVAKMQDVKRLINFTFNDAVVKAVIDHWPLKVIYEQKRPKVCIDRKGSRVMFSEECSFILTSKLKMFSEGFLGGGTENTVVNVPRFLRAIQSQTLQNTGDIPDFNTLRAIYDSTVEAMAKGVHKTISFQKEKHLMIFHMTGSSFDGSVLNIQNAVFDVQVPHEDLQMEAQNVGNNGSAPVVKFNFKQRSYEIFKRRRVRCFHNDILKCAKYFLSFYAYSSLRIDLLSKDVALYSAFAQSFFETMTSDFLSGIMKLIEKTLIYANFGMHEISDVTRGTENIIGPKVWKVLRDFLDGNVLDKMLDSNEVILFRGNVNAIFTITQKVENGKTIYLALFIDMSGGVMTPIIKTTLGRMNQFQLFTGYLVYEACVSLQTKRSNTVLTPSNNSPVNTRRDPVNRDTSQMELAVSSDNSDIPTTRGRTDDEDLVVENIEQSRRDTESRSTEESSLSGASVAVAGHNLFGRGDEGQCDTGGVNPAQEEYQDFVRWLKSRQMVEEDALEQAEFGE